MNSIKTIITESFIDRRVKIFVDDFKENGNDIIKSISKYGYPFRYDELDASQITVYNNPKHSTVVKEMIACVTERDYTKLFVIRMDSHTEAVIIGKKYFFNYDMKENKASNGVDYSIRIKNKAYSAMASVYNYDDHYKKAFEKVVSAADEVWKFDMKEVMGSTLKRNRAISRTGFIEFNEQTFLKIATENRKRYKQLAAELRIKNGTECVEIQKKCHKLVNIALNLVQEFSTIVPQMSSNNISKYDNLKNLIWRINNDTAHLLNRTFDVIESSSEVKVASRELEKKKQAEIESEYFKNKLEYSIKTYRKNIEYFNSDYDYLDKKVKEFQQALKDFLQTT